MAAIEFLALGLDTLPQHVKDAFERAVLEVAEALRSPDVSGGDVVRGKVTLTFDLQHNKDNGAWFGSANVTTAAPKSKAVSRALRFEDGVLLIEPDRSQPRLPFKATIVQDGKPS